MSTDELRKKIDQTVLMIFRNHHQEPTEEDFDLWQIALNGLTIEQLKKGMSRSIRERKSAFLPTCGEFIALCTSSTEDDLESLAAFGWVLVARSVSSIGSYANVCFSDPVISSAIQSAFGGWIQLCSSMTPENEQWKRKEFMKAYKGAFGRSERKILTGRNPQDEVRFIGEFEDQEKKELIESRSFNAMLLIDKRPEKTPPPIEESMEKIKQSLS